VTGLAREIASELRTLPRANTLAIRAIRREYSRRLRTETGDVIKAVAHSLQKDSAPGARVVACELILHHPAALAGIRARDLEKMGTGMNSWGDVDVFGCLLAGPVWRAHQVPDSLIHRWARRSDRWWRRAALVSTVPLNVKAQGGTGDAARTLGVCRLLISDRDDMVVKALSWALRSLAQRDTEAVHRFLKDHNSRLAPRVLREVNNKLKTGLKNPKPASRPVAVR
jgi:3-methyladenine DNA glycosylase AlkD